MDGAMRLALVVIGCVGCGGGESPEPPCDVEGASDAVTVLAGVAQHVVFHDAHGGVLSRSITDDHASATGVITPCGAVTVVGAAGDITTVTHVQPGDIVSLRAPAPVSAGPSHQLAIEFPLVLDATTYELIPGSSSGSCSCSPTFATTSPAIINVDACCTAADGSTAITARAFGPWVVMYASLERVATTTATITSWRTDRYDAHVAFTNLPDPSLSRHATVVQFAGALEMESIGLTFFDGLGDLTLAHLGDQVLVQAVFGEPGVDSSSVLYRAYSAPLASPVAVDGDDLAPIVTSVSGYHDDPARPVVAWTTSRPTDDEHAIVIIGRQWTVIAPANQPGALRYPELPADLRPAVPEGGGEVMVVRSSLFRDYSEARRLPRALLRPLELLPRERLEGFSYRASKAGVTFGN
jgi:hypothetical protein